MKSKGKPAAVVRSRGRGGRQRFKALGELIKRHGRLTGPPTFEARFLVNNLEEIVEKQLFRCVGSRWLNAMRRIITFALVNEGGWLAAAPAIEVGMSHDEGAEFQVGDFYKFEAKKDLQPAEIERVPYDVAKSQPS